MKNKDLHILVVEDEAIASVYLSKIMQSLGVVYIYDASSFDEALKIVQTYPIDLIFMDININGSIDGIQSAKLLNQEYLLPIIYTTAYGDSQTIKEASETNIIGFLIKPFQPNEVEAILTIALKQISLQKQYRHRSIKQINIVELGHEQKYNLLTQTFYIHNIPINLTKKENDILYMLCKNLNQNISYDILRESIWENKDISHSTIRDTMSRLKKKAPDLNLETVINFGYILKKF
jgi:DNA-binding response OmpR family regulator